MAKVFADPCMAVAVCHLLRDSSLSVTQKLSSMFIPATTITRLSIQEQRDVETGRLEARMVTLEKSVSRIQTMVIKEKEKNIESVKHSED